MEISIKSQLICAVAALVYGVVSAVLFGLFRFICCLFGVTRQGRLSRFKFILNRTVQFVFDLLFCVVVSVGFQILLYALDCGRFRLVYLLSAAVGFVLYDKTFGKLTDKLFGIIADFLGRIISFIFRYLSLPLKLLFSAIGKTVEKAVETVVLKPYRAYVRQRNVKNIRKIIEYELTDLIKF